MIIDNKQDIELYRLLALKHALNLEILGMERRGQSVYKTVKEEFDLTGNKKSVYNQLVDIINNKK